MAAFAESLVLDCPADQTGISRKAWFCVRSQPRHEHIVAAHLRKMEGIEVFLPRVRFQRATRQGMAWVTEALFPAYLFVRFDWEASHRQVQSASGARDIVHFGGDWPTLPEKTIEELRQFLGSTELNTVSAELVSGDAVQIADGTFRGLGAVISRVMPGRQRVTVLMEFLGNQTVIELDRNSIIKEGQPRMAVFSERSL